MENASYSGIVKFYNQEKGYGFIQYSEEGKEKDVFFHVTDSKDGHLDKEQKVTFKIGEGRKGPCAREVVKS